MPFTKVRPNENSVEIEIEKLVPFNDYPLRQLKGRRLMDMVESVRTKGVVQPILVRPAYDGEYEILNGHYRVAAAESLGLKTIPAIVREGLSEEEALLLVSDTSPLGLLVKHDIDIFDENYRTSESYRNNEKSRVFPNDGFSMALDEYIERYLLTAKEACDAYESIYDMGNPYELNDDECEHTALAREIIRVMPVYEDVNEAKKWLKVERSVDVEAAKEYDKTEAAKDLAHTFTRPGGYAD